MTIRLGSSDARTRVLLLAVALGAAIAAWRAARTAAREAGPATPVVAPSAAGGDAPAPTERRARLAAADVASLPRGEPPETFELAVSADDRLTVSDAVRLTARGAAFRASPSLRIVDDTGTVIPLGSAGASLVVHPPDDLELHVRPPEDRPDLPETLTVPVRSALKGFVVPRSHRVRVRVEMPAGTPLARAQVLCTPEGVSWRAKREGIADDQGRWTIDRLAPTDVVHVQGRPPANQGPPAASPEFVVSGDADQDLLLIVAPRDAGDLFIVRIEGGSELRGADAVLVSEPDGGIVARCRVSDASSCWFENVPGAASYTLWIPPLEAGAACVYASQLRPADGDSIVHARPSRTLRVHPTTPGIPTGRRVMARRFGIAVPAVPDPDGSFVFLGLPDGRVQVDATAWSDEPEVRLLTGSIDANAGEDVVLPLR